MPSREASALNIACFGVATLGVGFQRRFQWHAEVHLQQMWRIWRRRDVAMTGVAKLGVGFPI
jgi:hypothetical protein